MAVVVCAVLTFAQQANLSGVGREVHPTHPVDHRAARLDLDRRATDGAHPRFVERAASARRPEPVPRSTEASSHLPIIPEALCDGTYLLSSSAGDSGSRSRLANSSSTVIGLPQRGQVTPVDMVRCPEAAHARAAIPMALEDGKLSSG